MSQAALCLFPLSRFFLQVLQVWCYNNSHHSFYTLYIRSLAVARMAHSVNSVDETANMIGLQKRVKVSHLFRPTLQVVSLQTCAEGRFVSCFF